ncbi:hypothetical protein CANCADRAFT_55378 [Tortispora caseinolytica NRRL Y-17796]|uniref:mannose-1-phosphate guanylyltransferase n=1 Tax=Tortispora caseinolytica NRRL Y-17796 TaxID=767744 RepID=A0A1E4TID7_9ASCO|nr:hypothetical protein CANCADRAFT_55378 [Tortispora caseinolytica NRRL Y-17796]
MAEKAVILVGGGTRGTRFRPLSLDIPKVLFPVAGKPMLSHILVAISKVSTVKEVLLIGFFDDYVFRDFLADASSEFTQFSVKYLREYTALGTAGGMYHFRDVVLRNDPKKFFVIHADICCSFPLLEIQELAAEKQAGAVIMGTRVPYDDVRNFGAIVADEKGAVVHYVQNPESRISNLINGGIYLFDSSIFDVIREAQKEKFEKSYEEPVSPNPDDNKQILTLEQDILGRLAEHGSLYVYETKAFWRQIKAAGAAVAANKLYLQSMYQRDPSCLTSGDNIVPPVYVDPTAFVDPTAKIGPYVSIGPRSRVGPGARVKNAIVLEDCEIKRDSCTLNAILARGTRVGAWARVEGTPIPDDSHDTTVVMNGLKVQATTILSTDVTVGDEVRVCNCVVLPHKEIKVDVNNEVIM